MKCDTFCRRKICRRELAFSFQTLIQGLAGDSQESSGAALFSARTSQGFFSEELPRFLQRGETAEYAVQTIVHVCN